MGIFFYCDQALPSWSSNYAKLVISGSFLNERIVPVKFQVFRYNSSGGLMMGEFYEWKEVGGKKKQPYFIYFPQDEDVFTKDASSFLDGDEWRGPKLLTMAGIFDVWKSPEKETYYSYSVVTMESSNTMSAVHSRMPAILNGEEEVSMWLDTDEVSTEEAIRSTVKALFMLQPLEDIQMHPVSTIVGNSRNNSSECVKPFR
ncbi:UNVERIFIED_CONTAM: Embryonic stem cell-specific 5-hydroxymethylcytosine-binding protein [Trichonephila clavipes]